MRHRDRIGLAVDDNGLVIFRKDSIIKKTCVCVAFPYFLIKIPIPVMTNWYLFVLFYFWNLFSEFLSDCACVIISLEKQFNIKPFSDRLIRNFKTNTINDIGTYFITYYYWINETKETLINFNWQGITIDCPFIIYLYYNTDNRISVERTSVSGACRTPTCEKCCHIEIQRKLNSGTRG